MENDPNEKLKKEYFDEQAEKAKWFLEVQERAKNSAHNTVERYAPNKAALALWLLAQGARLTDIRKKTGLSREVIRALEWRHNDTLETKRKEFSMRYAIAAQEYTDLLFERSQQLFDAPEELAKISPDKLAVTVGILTDKAAQLTGMATSRVEHVKGPSLDDAAKMIADAKARIASKVKAEAVEAEIVESEDI